MTSLLIVMEYLYENDLLPSIFTGEQYLGVWVYFWIYLLFAQVGIAILVSGFGLIVLNRWYPHNHLFAALLAPLAGYLIQTNPQVIVVSYRADIFEDCFGWGCMVGFIWLWVWLVKFEATKD